MPFPAGLRALNDRDFRLFWTGQLVSLNGTWMQSVCQSWLVLELTNSPFKLGLIGTLKFGPMLFFSFPVGAIADRVPKRRLILATQTALMLQAFLLAGFSQIVCMASCNTILQVAVPDTLRGRIMSLYAFVFAGVTPFGSFFVGSIAEVFGVPVAFAAGGGLGLLCVLGLTWRWTRGRSWRHLTVGWP